MKRRVGAAVDSRPVFCAFKTHRDVVIMRKMDETAERTRTSFLVENRTEMIRMWMSFICLENSETRRDEYGFVSPPLSRGTGALLGQSQGTLRVRWVVRETRTRSFRLQPNHEFSPN